MSNISSSAGSSLLSALSRVPDHRRHNRVHSLSSILTMSVCAMLCGARSLFAIAQWGRDNALEIAGPLGLAGRRHANSPTPCHASLHYVFADLNISAFEEALSAWIAQFCPASSLGPGGVAVDGKSLRGIHGEQIAGVHLVAAFAHSLGLPLAQQAVAGKGHELTGARNLFDALDLRGVVITGDALYCQRDLCETIVQKGAIISSASKPISPNF